MGRWTNDKIVLLIILVLTGGIPACIKEYSNEGGPATPVADTLPTIPVPPVGDTFICPECIGKDRYEQNRWSFWHGNSFLCGMIDTAIVGADRDVFTFFGTSLCSIDTNLVISVFLDNEKLDRNRQNLVIPKVAFFVSVNAGSVYWLQAKPGTPFTMTIISYDHQTRMAIGSFTGTAYKQDGTTTMIRETKFQVRLM
jgi:hypothetical protein